MRASTTIKQALKNDNIWVFLMMFIGSLLVVGRFQIHSVYKFQNSIYVYEGPVYKRNFHPFLQTMTMFTGELIALPIFYIFRILDKQACMQKERLALKEGKKIKMNRFYFLFLSFFDLLTSTMQFVAFNFISTSAYQIMKGGTIITSFIFSITFLKEPIKKRQLAGSMCAFFGMFIVGLAHLKFSSEASETDGNFLQILGYFLMIGSLFTNAFFYAVQQKLLRTYHIEPLQIVGFQGLFGLIISIVILPILCYTPCPFGESSCVYSRQGSMYIEGLTVFFDELAASPTLRLLAIISIFGTFLFNVVGVTVTKFINALARVNANMTRSISVWIVGLFVTITLGSIHPNFRWQKLEFHILLVETLGFISVALGTFIYNDILKIPMFQQKIQPTLDSNEMVGQQLVVLSKRLVSEQQQTCD